jgi:hypothetical protein
MPWSRSLNKICPPTHVGSYTFMNDLKFAFRRAAAYALAVTSACTIAISAAPGLRMAAAHRPH